MRKINWLVIHTAATRPSMDIGKKEIDQWHRQRGFNGIGYHYVIRRDGKIEKGRKDSVVGAHVAGHNSDSLGICLVGGVDENLKPANNYTPAQWVSLEKLLHALVQRYPDALVTGHRDFPGVHKACPCFDAEPWAASKGFRTKGKRRQAVVELKKSRTVKGSILAAASLGGTQLNELSQQVTIIPNVPDWVTIVFGLAGLVGVGLIIFARVSDAINNPKFSGDTESPDAAD